VNDFRPALRPIQKGELVRECEEVLWEEIACTMFIMSMVGLLVWHGDVEVHAENQKGARELLEFFDNVLVTLAGRND